MGAETIQIGEELLQVHHPEVIVLPTPEEVDLLAARIFTDQVAGKPDSAVTLFTGDTSIGFYARVLEAIKSGKVDLTGMTTFNLDEYYPLPQSHPTSYHTHMNLHFFDQLDSPVLNRHIPNSEAADIDEEVALYERQLAAASIDLAFLGIGPGTTCHVGFNERGSTYNSRTRYVDLDPQTIAANASHFANPKEIPPGAITQGIGNILKAKRIVLLAKGKGKAWGIQRTLEGSIGSDAPASFLRLHPQVTFVIDSAAAHMLKR